MAAGTELEQTVVVSGTPGGIGGAPTPGREITIAAAAAQEYVAGSSYSWYSNVAHALPWQLDDVSRDFGADIYQRMLLDSQVRKVTNVIKAAILEDGLSVTSAIEHRDADGYDQARELVDTVERMLADLATSLDDVLWDMLDAIAVGNRVAEQVYTLDTSLSGRSRYALAHLTVKPFNAYAFVVDVYFNLIGILGRVPGQPFGVQQGTLLADLEHTVNLLPRSKFAVLTFRPHDSDPRGTSVIRPAFDPWNQKQQVKREFLKYLTQFATPSLIGYTAPDADPYQRADANGVLLYDTQGNPLLQTPEQDMLAALQQFANGVATVFPNGASVQPVEMTGDGQAYLNAFDFWNREISNAVLHQTLATEEGLHQTRASSGIQKDTLDTIVRQAKRPVARMLTRDVLRVWLQLNGQEQLMELLPVLSLGTAEQEDRPALWMAAAALRRAGYIHSSQYAELDRTLGLPERTPPDASTVPVTETIQDKEAGLVSSDGTNGSGSLNGSPPALAGDGAEFARAARGRPVLTPELPAGTVGDISAGEMALESAFGDLMDRIERRR